MANIFHRIKGYLYKNPLPPDPNDFLVRVLSEPLIMIPNPETGTYLPEETTQFTKGSILKDPNTILFNTILTVQ
jgi:hypothetical protein